jgi:hypothetical protein
MYTDENCACKPKAPQVNTLPFAKSHNLVRAAHFISGDPQIKSEPGIKWAIELYQIK